MNELVTRWDWICLGICVGIFVTIVAQKIQLYLDTWFITNELKLQKALASDLLKMQEKLNVMREGKV